MGWNIPELPSLQVIKRPSYLMWGIACIIILVISFGLTLFLYQDNDTSLFWLFAIVLPFTLWLIMFSCRWVYHGYLMASNQEIAQYQQYLTKKWQAWSQVQIPIFGHAIICAEPDGLQALTADATKIPLYPQKARPLFNMTASTKAYWFLDDVMRNLAQQCANYRKYLTHIYLPYELIEDDELVEAIFQRWDLQPQPINDYAVFMANMYQTADEVELSLLLVCQYSEQVYHNHSKFISALLLGRELMIDKGLEAKAWLGRLMVTNETNLSDDIKQLFTYTQLAPKRVKDIWTSGLNEKTQTALTMTKYELDIGGNSESTFHHIDLTFAKPTNLTHYFGLTMASCGVGTYFREQLTVSQDQGQIFVQLISPKKLG